ncbi:MAG: acetyl-lysine deacetylase [Nitrososphaerota archaeon]
MREGDEAVNLLRRLLKAYSPTGREGRVAKLLLEELRARGIDAYTDEAGNVLAHKKGPGPRILLAGHMDTVRGYIPVRRRGEELCGRGAVDAKGPLACLLFAFLEGEADMTFAGLVDEEGGSRGARALTVPRPEYVIVGEPSGWEGVAIAYRGSLTLRMRARVERFHASSSAKGAAELLIDRWLKLSEGFGPGFYRPSGRILSFKAREGPFAYEAEMVVNVRIPPGAAMPSCGEVLEWTPPYELAPTRPLVRAFVRAIRRQRGRPQLKKKLGTSDLNLLAARFACEAVAYGPGDSSLDHTPHERISLQEYLRALEVLKGALLELRRA